MRHRLVDPVVFLYRSESKVSIRASLNILSPVDQQRAYLEGLKQCSQHEIDTIRAETQNPKYNTLFNIIVCGIDLAVHRVGASIRLPWFPKIKRDGDGMYKPDRHSAFTDE